MRVKTDFPIPFDSVSKIAVIMHPVENSPEGNGMGKRVRKLPELKEWTKAIGRRVAELRKERGVTQFELAEKLGVSQPDMSDYERGELRLHGYLIARLAEILGVRTDELLGLERPKKADGGAKNRLVLRRLRQIENLPKRDRQALIRVLDGLLAKHDRIGDNTRRTRREVA